MIFVMSIWPLFSISSVTCKEVILCLSLHPHGLGIGLLFRFGMICFVVVTLHLGWIFSWFRLELG
ncbi:hypothetical protein I3843_06G051700 [Carya illinoinensis]|nr:hypothetical protein I3843_06G051700 [Carya illinoinensis]